MVYKIRRQYGGYLSCTPATNPSLASFIYSSGGPNRRKKPKKRGVCGADASRASLRRYRHKLGQIQWDACPAYSLLTLTFAPEFQTHSRLGANATFREWTRHFLKDRSGKVVRPAIWCAERCLRGQIHFHLIIFGAVSHKEVWESWRAYSGAVPQATHVQAITETPRRAAMYFSGYMGKGGKSSGPSAEGGQVGARDARDRVRAKGAPLLDNGSYLGTNSSDMYGEPLGGRTWGIIGWRQIAHEPDKIRYADLKTSDRVFASENLAKTLEDAHIPGFEAEVDRQPFYDSVFEDDDWLGSLVRVRAFNLKAEAAEKAEKARASSMASCPP